jgi:hypothetical protein
VKCCPNCEKPSQFGELCPACTRDDQERIEETREQPEPEWEYRCPNCKAENDVDVQIRCMARVCYRDGEFSGTAVDEATSGDHEWVDDSLMECRKCGHSAKVWEFTPDGRENRS